MFMPNETENISEVKSGFLDTVKKIETAKVSIQEDYSVDKMEQIMELEREKEKMFAELVRAGEPYYLDDNQIILTLDGTEYHSAKERIEKHFTEEEKKLYFTVKEKDVVPKDDDFLYDSEEYHERINSPKDIYAKKYKEMEGVFMPQVQNPLQNPYQIAPYLLFPYMQLQGMYSQILQSQPSYYDTNEEVVDLQRKLILMEQEKNWSKEDLSQIKAKYENLKNSVNEQKDRIKENEQLLGEISKLKKEIEDMEARNTKLSDENAELHGTCKKIKAENESLLEDIGLSKIELDQVSTELNASKNMVKDIQKQLDDAHMEIERLSKTLDEEKKGADKTAAEIRDEYESKAKRQESVISDLKSSLEKTKNSAEREKIDLKVEINNKKAEIESLKKDLSDKENQLREREKKNKDSQKKLDEFKNKAKENDEKAARMEELESNCSSLTSKNKDLRTEVAKKEKEIADLKAGQKESEHLRQSVSDYEKRVKELEELAYKDKNTKVWNANAFNRDMKTITPSSVAIIRVGIADMRTINSNQGKKTGDHTISRVARVLEQLSVGSVYRVYGDNFTVVVQKGIDINNCMNRAKQELSKNGIEIYYGAGTNASSIKDLIREAEENMSHARGTLQVQNMNGSMFPGQEMNMYEQAQQQQFLQQPVMTQPQPIDITQQMAQSVPSQGMLQNIPQNSDAENDEDILNQIM